MEINELLSSYLKKVHWAFVGLTHPGNLGAILRALKNTGCESPILIDPAKNLMINSPQVLSRASHARECVHDVKLSDLETALEGSRMVIGFTARDRDIQIPKISFEETLKSVSDNLLRWEDFHVSFVFGSEKSGLSNKELSRCTRVCAFDLDEEYPSLNISHATLLVAYFTRNTLRKAILRNNNYLHKKHWQNCSFVTIKKPACQKTLYGLEKSMIQLGEQINFFKQGNREKSEIKMRRWIINNTIEEEDAKLMISFFSEIRKKLN